MDDHVGEMVGNRSGQPNLRPAPHIGDHLDVAVNGLRQHRTLGEPGTRPRLDDGLLGGPARREMPRGEGTLVGGVAPLTRGERLGEYRAGLVDLLGKLGDGHQIDPDSHYRHAANLS